MKDILKNDYVRRTNIFALILIGLFSLITLISRFSTKIYLNSKQLELFNIARENDAYNSPVCFFKDDYAFGKFDIDDSGEGE